MAGKKRRNLKLLAETIMDDERVANEDKEETLELQTWSDLPTELLERIMRHLTMEDNIRASVACKRWHSVAFSIRVLNPSPWILYFPKSGVSYEFYDPSQRKTYFLELPELHGSTVCYAKEGWLLLYKSRSHSIFFFNPFTRELIKLPIFEMTCQIVAFSSSPTSSSCVVFTLKHVNPTVVAISTCHPGASEWTTANYPIRLPFVSSIWNKLVFCSGVFYCLSLTGWIGIFDPLERTWDVLNVPPPKCPKHFYAKSWWKGKFLAEHDREIYVIYTCCSENPMIFKLNEIDNMWEKKETLDGVTLFVSFLSSHSRTDVQGLRRNSVYFSKVRFYGKRCILYSLDDYRYYPCKQYYDWGEQDPFESIWIEPPQDIAKFISRS